MFKKFHIGIMGAGNIAGVMAETIKKMKGVKLYAVASRQQVSADVFAGKYGCKKAYGSYEDLVKDKKVDLIYIATPHSEHFENAKLCILHGKPVLCEKAFTANAAQAEELVKLARERNVFLAEAIWTRYMPMVATMQQVIGSGVIGEIKTLTANLGYVVGHLPRMQEPKLCGGALLDLGIYPLTFAFMMLGTHYDRVESSCSYAATGVDEQNSITLYYPDGKVAHLNSTMVSVSDRKGMIYGTKGFAVVENINNFQSITVFDNSYKKLAEYKCPKQISGYEYEVEACMKAISKGELECVEMPHYESIRVMKFMDELRKEWGVVYPYDADAQFTIPKREETVPAGGSVATEEVVTEEVVTEEVVAVAEMTEDTVSAAKEAIGEVVSVAEEAAEEVVSVAEEAAEEVVSVAEEAAGEVISAVEMPAEEVAPVTEESVEEMVALPETSGEQE
ncbi:MAG: Gfo/Idh/MocA family oxidoreductase [Lachnospiraceae bacterium]|nr:Gfo/Idh/MocA family oxidoreductase [Lachnospiraceae bacterium]